MDASELKRTPPPPPSVNVEEFWSFGRQTVHSKHDVSPEVTKPAICDNQLCEKGASRKTRIKRERLCKKAAIGLDVNSLRMGDEGMQHVL
jgi:hypothetical protein